MIVIGAGNGGSNWVVIGAGNGLLCSGALGLWCSDEDFAFSTILIAQDDMLGRTDILGKIDMLGRIDMLECTPLVLHKRAVSSGVNPLVLRKKAFSSGLRQCQNFGEFVEKGFKLNF